MRNVWNSLKHKWFSYRYRFVPWVAFNLKEKTHRSVNQRNDKIISDRDVAQRLLTLFVALHEEKRNSEVTSWSTQRVLHKVFGFAIDNRKSVIPGAGTGVFVSQGKVTAGSIVALYPGTVYRAMEPLFFQSIGNPFIFRCIDGLHIDGRDRGISAKIFKSCVYRELRWPYFPADLSWVTEDRLVNPLNCGQYVNNETPEFPCNVAYQECDLPLETFPIELRCYLPNIYYGTSENHTREFLRIVALVAIKDIEVDTELLSTYYTVVHA